PSRPRSSPSASPSTSRRCWPSCPARSCGRSPGCGWRNTPAPRSPSSWASPSAPSAASWCSSAPTGTKRRRRDRFGAGTDRHLLGARPAGGSRAVTDRWLDRYEALSLDAQIVIDELCSRYEASLRAGEAPSLEVYLQESSVTDPAALLAEL